MGQTMKPRARFNSRLLEKLRVDKCLTQEELATLLDVVPRSIYNWTDDGYVGMPRPKTIRKLVEYFNVPSEKWIIWRSEEGDNT